MRSIFVGEGTKLFAVGKKISYSYDNNGNTVQDGLKGLQISYNILNLPQTVTQGEAVKATYGWFADGSKYSVQDAQGNGYCYIGSLIYSTTAGAAVLESTDFSGGRIVLSGNTQTIHYHHKDHLGSVRTITDNTGAVIEQNAYYPFGGRHTFGQTYAQTTSNRYKFNGKEQQTIGSLDLLDYGARMYDTKTARWLVQDPLAEKYYPFSAYNYCVNNPVMFVDPDGKDIYRYDKKTGEFILYEDTSDNFDQIGDFKKNRKTGEYELKTKKDGTYKIKIDNIEKNILSVGVNFLEKSQVWSTDNVSIEGFQQFIIQFSDMIGKEIAGHYYTNNNSNEISYIYAGKYINNTYDKSFLPSAIWNTRLDLYGTVQVHTQWHTHPSNAPSKMYPSRQDYSSKDTQKRNGVKRFIILTGGNPPIQY